MAYNSEAQRTYYLKNKSRLLAKAKERYKLNKKSKIDKSKKYYQDNTAKCLATKREYYLINATEIKKKRNRETSLASSPYVKGLLARGTALVRADIPDELMKVKREHLRAKRMLWKI